MKDYGYFGKGSSGYAHYNQTQNEYRKGPKNNPGYGMGVWGLVLIAVFVHVILEVICKSIY